MGKLLQDSGNIPDHTFEKWYTGQAILHGFPAARTGERVATARLGSIVDGRRSQTTRGLLGCRIVRDGCGSAIGFDDDFGYVLLGEKQTRWAG